MTNDIEPLYTGKCPDCACAEFRLGPQGGMNRNVECTGCRSRFNVAVVRGTVLFADRIESRGSWLMYRTTGPLSDAEVMQ